MAESLGTARPDRLTGGPHIRIAVLGLHALVGRVLAMARALPCRLLMVGEPLRRGPRAEADPSLQQRAFDEAAIAGAMALVKRGENALHRPHPGAETANRQQRCATLGADTQALGLDFAGCHSNTAVFGCAVLPIRPKTPYSACAASVAMGLQASSHLPGDMRTRK